MQPRLAEPHEVPPRDGELDVEAFEHAVDDVYLAQEIIVDYSSYPTPEIDKNAKAYRQLGLGYANLGALLMARGLPYVFNTSDKYFSVNYEEHEWEYLDGVPTQIENEPSRVRGKNEVIDSKDSNSSESLPEKAPSQ